MEPGDHLVVEHWPGPGRASARHGGAQLCSLNRARPHARKADSRGNSSGEVKPNVISIILVYTHFISFAFSVLRCRPKTKKDTSPQIKHCYIS
jgi:hypothetical protein